MEACRSGMFSLIHISQKDEKDPLLKIFECIDGNDLQNFQKTCNENLKMVNSFIDGQAPIHRATQLGRLEFIKHLLLECKAKSDLKSTSGDTLWHIVLRNKSTSTRLIVDFLLEDVEKSDSINSLGQSPLDLIIEDEDEVLLQRFLEKGFKRVNIFQAAAKTSIFLVIAKKLKVNIFSLNDLGQSLLHAACKNGNVALAKSLLCEGLDVNVIDKNGMTALHFAITSENFNLVKFLVFNRATLKVKRSFLKNLARFEPIIHTALLTRNEEVVSFLIEQRAPLNDLDCRGRNAVNLATHIDIANDVLIQLIRAGSDPTIKDIFENSAVDSLADNQVILLELYNNEKYNSKVFEPLMVKFITEPNIPKPCLICRDVFNVVDSVPILPCKHEFHQECLFEWFKTSITCPLCKEKAVSVRKDSRFSTKKLALTKRLVEFFKRK